jgi:hypothetical protein
VARQICHRWLIQTSTGIDIDSIDDIFGLPCIALRMYDPVLSGWGEQQASIRGESKPAKERREGLFTSVYSFVAKALSPECFVSQTEPCGL